MQNQSPFVKFMIWFMVFLMSIGFAFLVISPFMGGTMFGDGSGRGATEKLLEQASVKIRDNDCNADKIPAGKRRERCRDAFIRLGAAYQTLAYPSSDQATELPKDFRRNIERAGDAYKAAYSLDKTDATAAKQYAAFLRDNYQSNKALPIWEDLVKADPNQEDYLLQLAVAHSQIGDYDEAIATYRSFIKRFPDSGQVSAIKEEIESLKEQKNQSMSGAGGLNAGDIDLSTLQ